MIRIFAVWSHHDREVVDDLRIAAAKSSPPIAVFDEIEVQPGWMSVAERNIRDADCVLLVLTSHSASSPFCEQEVLYASSVGKRVMVWSPAPAQAYPEWIPMAGRLSDETIDAAQAVAHIVISLDDAAG